MRHSIEIALVFGGLIGGGCKKKDSWAKVEPAKTQEGTKKPEPSPGVTAAANATPSAGVVAGGIQHEDKEGPAGVVTTANGTVEVRRVGETQFAAAKATTKLYPGDTIRTA